MTLPKGITPSSADQRSYRRVIHGIMTLSTGQILTWGCGIGLAILLPRYGDAGLGKLSIAFSITDVFALVASLGVGSHLTKEVARNASDSASWIVNALAMRAPLGILAGVLAMLATAALGYDEATTRLIHIYCLYIPIAAIGSVLMGALQGMQLMQPIAGIGVLSKLLMVGLVAVFLSLGVGLPGVAIAGVISTLAGVVWGFWAVARRRGLAGCIDFKLWRILLLAGLPFLIWEAALVLYGRIGVLLLSRFSPDEVIGWYEAAFRVVGIPVVLPVIVMTAVFPLLAQAARQDRIAFDKVAAHALGAVLIATLPITVGILILPNQTIQILGYPSEFVSAVPLIVILALHIPLVGVDMIIGTVLNTLDKQRSWAMTAVAAAVISTVLNFIAIPAAQDTYGNGALAAAAVTVLTELFLLVTGLVLLRGAVFRRPTAILALKCLAASLTMALVVWSARELPLGLLVALGAAVYILVVLALRAVTMQELILLRGHTLGRFQSAS